MVLHFDYTTRVTFHPSVGRHNILLRCLPAQEAFQQVVCEEFSVSPCFWHREDTDGFGNRIIYGGTMERHSELSYRCRGNIKTSTYCIPDSNPHPMYSVLPSVPPSLLSKIVSPRGDLEGALEGASKGALEDALHIMHSVHQYMTYRTGVTDINTSLMDVIRLRQGVCQDYAHLMIALCRLAGYPSRYVCGLMRGEGATHAWVEIHDGQCWYAFDPTNDTAIADGYIKLAHGREAKDCPVSRGTYIGVTQETTEVCVKAFLL